MVLESCRQDSLPHSGVLREMKNPKINSLRYIYEEPPCLILKDVKILLIPLRRK
jgi:hypothetical protein